jgi:hypothetical protein
LRVLQNGIFTAAPADEYSYSISAPTPFFARAARPSAPVAVFCGRAEGRAEVH